MCSSTRTVCGRVLILRQLNLFDMTKALLRLGSDVKDAVLSYFSLCLRKNEARAKMQVRLGTSSNLQV